MEDIKKTELFERTPIPKAFLKLTVPTVMASLVMIIYNLADTFFVGMLNDPIQNSAVTLAAPIMMAFYAITNLFGVGSSSMMSRALGRHDFETVYKSSAFGFWCGTVCAITLSLVATLLKPPLLSILGATEETSAATSAYMMWTVSFGALPSILNVLLSNMVRAEGSAFHASVGTMSGCLINIILDPLFILPQFLDMGAAGAGLATFISNCFACFYYLVLLYLKRGKTYVCIDPRKFTFEREISFGVFGVGIPAAIQNLLNVLGMTVFNNLTASYGPDAVAGMGIAQKVNQVAFSVALGLSQGIMPLIGYNYAGGNIKRMKKTIAFSLKVSITFLVIATVFFRFNSENIVWLFIKNENIVNIGARILRGFCLTLVFIAVDFITVGIFQACGKGSISLFFAILRKAVFEIPFIIIFNKIVPLYGLAYAQTFAEVILCVIAIAVLLRFFKKIETKSMDHWGVILEYKLYNIIKQDKRK
ncbi:MAG: MATE family efflux transporter [Clostridia bacterium]|nr:MATE family efflux transporter [Clostridia bacterium]